MEDFLFHPVTWIVVIGILIALVVVSIMVSAKRSREVKELDNLFPEGSLSGENLEKIPVEKVRRSTIERDRKKQEREKQIPKKIRPKKGSKVFAEEDQEYILTNIRSNTQQHQVLKPRKQNIDAYDDIPDASKEFNNSSFQESSSNWSTEQQKSASKFRRNRNHSQHESDENGYYSKSEYTDSFSTTTSAPFSRSKKSYDTQTSSQTKRSNLSSRASRTSQQNTKYGHSTDTMKQSTRSRAAKYSTKKKFF